MGWVTSNLGSVSLQKFLDNPMLAKARVQAIKDLNIPKP